MPDSDKICPVGDANKVKELQRTPFFRWEHDGARFRPTIPIPLARHDIYNGATALHPAGVELIRVRSTLFESLVPRFFCTGNASTHLHGSAAVSFFHAASGSDLSWVTPCLVERTNAAGTPIPEWD